MILCVGTSPALQHLMTFAALVPGTVNRAQTTHFFAAGKCANVAKVAHALGAATRLLTCLGGPTGELIRRDLRRQDVELEAIEVAAPTRICTTAIDSADGTATEFVEESGPLSPAELAELKERFDAAIPEARVLVLSGSLAPGVPEDFYAWCAERANRHSVAALIDAQGEALRRALAHRPLLVKPNRAELSATLGAPIESDAQLQQAIGRLAASGPSWVAITAGGDEVTLSDGTNFWRWVPPRVAAVNPIGSGDAFAGGLAVAIARGTALPDALRLAIACGASNATHLEPGRIDPAQVALLADGLAAPRRQ